MRLYSPSDPTSVVTHATFGRVLSPDSCHSPREHVARRPERTGTGRRSGPRKAYPVAPRRTGTAARWRGEMYLNLTLTDYLTA